MRDAWWFLLRLGVVADGQRASDHKFIPLGDRVRRVLIHLLSRFFPSNRVFCPQSIYITHTDRSDSEWPSLHHIRLIILFLWGLLNSSWVQCCQPITLYLTLGTVSTPCTTPPTAESWRTSSVQSHLLAEKYNSVRFTNTYSTPGS